MSGGINMALLAFHKDAGQLDLAKNRSAHTSDYLDLDKAMEQIRPLLAQHGLFVFHDSGWLNDSGWYVRTTIIHAESGERLGSGIFPLAPTKNDPQGWGAALTYGRRYTFFEVLALVADNDDDGAGKAKRAPRAASGKITAAQRTEMMATARAASVPTDRLQEIVKRVAGVEASADIPAEKFAAVLAAIRKEKP